MPFPKRVPRRTSPFHLLDCVARNGGDSIVKGRGIGNGVVVVVGIVGVAGKGRTSIGTRENTLVRMSVAVGRDGTGIDKIYKLSGSK